MSGANTDLKFSELVFVGLKPHLVMFSFFFFLIGSDKSGCTNKQTLIMKNTTVHKENDHVL